MAKPVLYSTTLAPDPTNILARQITVQLNGQMYLDTV